jgi:hypothetical protein
MSIQVGRHDSSPSGIVNVVTETQSRLPNSISGEIGGVDLAEFLGRSLSVNTESAVVFIIADKTTIST